MKKAEDENLIVLILSLILVTINFIIRIAVYVGIIYVIIHFIIKLW